MALPRSEYLSDAWKDGIFCNKVVFCTGGGGTICSAQVRALVHLGANACIIGRNAGKTERMAQSLAKAREGAKVIGIGAVDVRDLKSLEAAVHRCANELGAIDYVIAGAAGNFLAPISGLSSNAFRTVLEIDTLGSYNTLKATLPYLLVSAKKNQNTGRNKSTGGRIIFVSATFHYAGTPLQAHAAAAKAGVDAISATAALEYGPQGITSNVITPGPIANTEGMARLGGNEDQESADAVFRSIPLQRYGTVKDIADGTVYLFSDTGNYITGAVLVIDGASWRSPSALGGLKYPGFLLDDSFTPTSGKKSKL
ncbi:hypothetical protein OIDMADRAFT_131789 [Oidiodendron maius Zn]|uniref:2,4-dienoyl-CoA reductase [(3E)-enoyl-CoA-producing] n=1 Tax=Oidiodendron maius (strain Zn) TaxID=913774 RepID=A0A0C3D4V3_OIDMZ|nr:hypothetical protein OIDMADRAFT_131789 [Oidiodendron maius Zn]